MPKTLRNLLPLFSFFILACQSATEDPEGQWITGSSQERLDITEKHFRGFDMAMVETGYRYQELYWAGLDGNWEYAQYQIDKIQVTIENGLERRPKRSASAQMFLDVALPEMQRSLQSKDTSTFREAFRQFTIQCNSCHLKEEVPYFHVQLPKHKLSPIQLP